MEAYTRRDTVRVFGLPELIDESYERLKQYVIEKVLRVVRPDIDWSPDDIVRPHKIGAKPEKTGSQARIDSNDDDKPRILLIKFHH